MKKISMVLKIKMHDNNGMRWRWGVGRRHKYQRSNDFISLQYDDKFMRDIFNIVGDEY